MALDPGCLASSLRTPLGEYPQQFRRQGDRFAGGEQRLKMAGEVSRWRLAQGGDVPDAAELKAKDRQVTVRRLVDEGLGGRIRPASRWFTGKAGGPRVGKWGSLRIWFVSGTLG